MSISPSEDQLGSSSSSSSSSPQNPNNLNHGNTSLPPPQTHYTLPIQSLRISQSQSSPTPISASEAPIAEGSISSESSKKVSESRKLNGRNSLTPHKNGKNSQRDAVGWEGIVSAQHGGKLSETLDSVHSQQSSGSIASQGSSMPSSVRKNQQMVNGNHLLNFLYDPISRPQPRAPPPRRQVKRKPYNKDLFLQANYKFVVLDTGNYAPESMDPDKMLQWEDVICVKYSTPFPVQCPICLEDPLCPQITSCGHIFCFPCILRYFLIGEDDHRGERWKKCPLCFMMIFSKDLYTIYIESVKQHSVGDSVEFMLLTRQKDSFTLSMKNKRERDTNEEDYDAFSKFTFTSDVDLSVRKAILDLDSWLARADSGLVDDLERLPYVCAAMERLEQRKKYWKLLGECNMNKACIYTDYHEGSHESPPPAKAAHAEEEGYDVVWGTPSDISSDKLKCLGNLNTDKLDNEACLNQSADLIESREDPDRVLPSSHYDSKSVERHTDDFRDRIVKDSYNFYQAVDGQHIILHPLNMKCLLRHCGSYDMLPHRIVGKILQLETVTQSEAIRRRYRYLNHFSLTTTFQLCEIDLREILPTDALSPFMDEIKNRERQRKRVAKKDREEQIKVEAAASHFGSMPFDFSQSFNEDPPTFSIDDFEALGSSSLTLSSPPTVGERKLFSSVARLGFAAAHDSPALSVQEANPLPKFGAASDSSGVTGMRNVGAPSFANVISRAKPPVEDTDASRMKERGKKGKKPSRVLLSTAGGRRY